jgi:hypothetical protein
MPHASLILRPRYPHPIPYPNLQYTLVLILFQNPLIVIFISPTRSCSVPSAPSRSWSAPSTSAHTRLPSRLLGSPCSCRLKAFPRVALFSAALPFPFPKEEFSFASQDPLCFSFAMLLYVSFFLDAQIYSAPRGFLIGCHDVRQAYH